MDRTLNPLSRCKSEGTKFDFRLHFHASRVPLSGWDKLVVSLLSIETGRVTVKTPKGLVRNGLCQWPDPVVESTRLWQNPTTGAYEEKLYKIFVQMGSLRAGILGETIINLSNYVTAESQETVPLPLRNCSAGTVLHVKVQCLTSKVGSREIEWQRSGSLDQEYAGSVSEENSSNSDISENLTVGSGGSSTSQNPTASNPQSYHRLRGGVPLSTLQRERPLPVSSANYALHSVDDSRYEDNIINGAIRNGGSSFGSGSGGPIPGGGRDASHMQQSPRPAQARLQGGISSGPSPQNWLADRMNPAMDTFAMDDGARMAVSMPQKLEAAEVTIQELREETLMWERHARRLNVDVETLRQQLAYETKRGVELKVRMSATEAERDGLEVEVEHLKALKMAPRTWGTTDSHGRSEIEGSRRMIKELQVEIEYEKQVNADLGIQIRKTQDANEELLSALADLDKSLQDSNKVVEDMTEENKRLREELLQIRGIDDGGNVEVGLRLENTEWQQRLRACEAIVAEREESIRRLELQMEADLAKGERELKERSEQVKELLLKVSDLESKLMEDRPCPDGNLQMELESFQVVVHALQREKEELLQQTENLQNNLEAQQAMKAQFEAEVVECGPEAENLDSMLAECRATVKLLESSLLEAKNEKILLESKYQNLVEATQCTISTFNAEKAGLQKNLDEAYHEIRTKAEAIAELDRQVGDLQVALNSHTMASKAFESRTTELLVLKQEIETRVRDLEEVNDGLSERLIGLEVELTMACKDRDGSKRELEIVTARCLDLESEINRLQSQHEQELQVRTSENVGVREKIAAMEVEMMQVEQRCTDKETELTMACKDRDSSKRELEIVTARCLDLEAEINMLQSQHEQELQVRTSENVGVREKIAAMEVEMMQVEQRCTDKETELQSLLGCKVDLETKLQQLSSLVVEKENTASQAMADASQCSREKMELENTLRSTEEKVKDLEELTLLQKLLEAKVKDFEELTLLQKTLEAKVKDADRELQVSKGMCEHLKQKLGVAESALQQQRVEHEEERIQFQKKLVCLEEEVLQKAERPYEGAEGIDSKVVIEWRERLQCLEDEKEELTICKSDLTQKEAELMAKIERLELLNQQLAAGFNDSEAEQLKKEIIRLQNQNSLLSRKEQELLSGMHTQEVLQEEVNRLQEANDLLEARLSNFVETAKNPFLLEKIVNLEMELAEAVEANNIYKLQLKSIFDKQRDESGSMGALNQLCDLDHQVIDEISKYKKKATRLEEELHSMNERYSLMSLKLAEAEAERGKLMMTVKSLKGARKI